MKTLEFNVTSAYLPYLINGEVGDLQDYEITTIDEFAQDVLEVGYMTLGGDTIPFKHFSHKMDEDAFFARCEVTDLKSTCHTLVAVYG